jgi:hypothetical protein
MNNCPQVITLVSVLFANVIILAIIFGPTPLATIFSKTPITYTLITIFKVVSVYTLCILELPQFAWFAAIMFAVISLFTYSLTTFVTYYGDTLNPLMKDAIDCLKKAKTHEERVACRKVALAKLRAKFIVKTKSK